MKSFNISESNKMKKYLDKIGDDATGKAGLMIITELEKDSFNLAPIDKGTLRASSKSGKYKMLVNEAIYYLRYGVVYARRRYFEGSQSGETKWAEVSMDRNKSKYKKMMIAQINKTK